MSTPEPSIPHLTAIHAAWLPSVHRFPRRDSRLSVVDETVAGAERHPDVVQIRLAS